MGRRKRIHRGSSFRDLLQDEGLYAEVTARAVKELLAEQLSEAMEREGLTKSEMARRLGTSRSGLDRLLDPHSDVDLRLHTLAKAAETMGQWLHFELRDR